MARQSNAAPVIIKRKKVVIEGGHHGGAWKVAYADFVTAMMAFFMLMWLLNATTEKQRRGIADYFNPTIAVHRTSGGGDSVLSGNSVMTNESLAHMGTGGLTDAQNPVQPKPDNDSAAEEERLAEVEKSLLARSGESMAMTRILRHVVTKLTDEGLVIELFDLPDASLFDGNTNTPTQTLRELAIIVADALEQTENDLAIAGYTRSYPLIMRDNPVWDLSSSRAHQLRDMLRKGGLKELRFARVTGHADKKPLIPDASHSRNNRIEVILLRRGR